MEITKKEMDGYTVVGLNGRLDTMTYSLFENEMNELFTSGQKKFIIDCSGLEYVSSSGLRVFLVSLKTTLKNGGVLKLCCLQKMIEEIFEMTGFSASFDIYNTLNEALK